MSTANATLDAPQTLTGLLVQRAKQHPQRVAYRFAGDSGEEIVWTYGDLDAKARLIGSELQRKYQPGERAMLVYPPGLEFIAGFFGLLYAGLVPVPATYPKPRRPLPRLDVIAEDCTPKVALTTADALGLLKLDEQSETVRTLDWLPTDTQVEVTTAFDLHHPQESDAAFLQYTSGSTSQPRGVVVSHGNVIHNLLTIREGFGLDDGQLDQPVQECCFWLPAYHDMGLIGGVLTPLFVGGTSRLMAPAAFLRSPIAWLDSLSSSGASISGAPNFAYDLCVEKTTQEQRAALDLSRWDIAFCGAEPIDAGTIERFATAFAPAGFRSSAFYPCYGLAEATLQVTGGQRDKEPIVLNVSREALTRRKVVSTQGSAEANDTKQLVGCGRALGDQQVLIVDPATQTELPLGEIGEVWVSGKSVANGYWGRSVENCSTFAATLAGSTDPFVRTGDLGFFNVGDADNAQAESDQPELFITGRIKDVIIIRGRNHYPQDIERTATDSHVAVDTGAAFDVATDGSEQLVVVHQVQREHRRGNLDEALQAIRTAIVQQHEIDPHAILLIQPVSLPLTTSGKVKRSYCRELYLEDGFKILAQWRSTLAASPLSGSVGSGQCGHAAAPKPASLEPDFLDSIGTMPPEELHAAVTTWMLALLATKVEATNCEISGDTPFAELGMDSMTSIELSLEFERALGLLLTPDVAWSHPTPATLSKFLAEQLQAAPRTPADLSPSVS
ncbi:Long-chain-fatty-acid--AMP ligase FadD26 [Adhaeretor mobilis]|uniref:Long-chain-fatty-acid--AMP ligase FadD26 n=2 Tax=Adhaeretor mobilis TaxID=1930276 RepID=A0A517N0N8_9BACT|nr:Long-chain-fatty-acid--AMP ligase FadD26 [Adhaeretor mobilis]